ncbi:MAG: BON domain-containing protein [Thiolinea sp.]
MLRDLCRIGMNMPEKRWWQWLAVGLFGLLLLTLLTRCNSIQGDIQSRAQSLLQEKNMSWASVNLQNRGRDAIISGEAPGAAERDEAIQLVRNLYGIRTIDHEITLKQYVSSTFNLRHSNEGIVLNGKLPDQATIDQTAEEIQQIYKTDRITNNLTVSDSTSTPKWLAGLTALLPAITATRNIELSASDDAININGDVETIELRDETMMAMQSAFGDQLQASLAVVKTGPSEEELAAIAAEEARKAEEAHQLAEAKKLEKERAIAAKKARLAAEAEAARKAQEEARLAAEAKLKAEKEKQLAAKIAEKARQEQSRLAAEAEAKRLADIQIAEAEKARQIAAARHQQMLMQQRYQMLPARTFRKVIVLPPVPYQANGMHSTIPQIPRPTNMVANCEQALNRLVSNNPPPFNKDSIIPNISAQALLGQLNTQIRFCGTLLQQGQLHIGVMAKAGNDDSPDNPANVYQRRSQTVVNSLQNHFGISPGLLRVYTTPDQLSGNTQLHFTITQ